VQGLYNRNGGENVIIGTDAGECNTNNRNVIIGYGAGRKSSATETVVIGAKAGPTAGGKNSVVIGYETASRFAQGNSNVFIGFGANSYLPDVDYGISIGTVNAFTNYHGISIGEEVYNQRAYSILMGFGIQSDADNSVLMGNTINIQSVIFFKDPLNYYLRNTVANDAQTKMGIRAITYGHCNQLLVSPAPESIIYNFAKAGIITSNVTNSTNNRPYNHVSPISYDLRTLPFPHHLSITLHGETFAIRNSDDQANTINRVITSYVNYENQVGTYTPLFGNCNLAFDPSEFVLTHSCNVQVTYRSGSHVKNIRNFTSGVVYDNVEFLFAKKVKSPRFSYSNRTVAFTSMLLDSSSNSIPILQLQSTDIVWDSAGIEGSNLGPVVVAIETPPQYIKLDKGLYNIGDTINAIAFKDQTFRNADTFTMRPILQITDANGFTYGRPGSAVEVNIDIASGMSNEKTLHRPYFLNCSNTPISSTDLFVIPTTPPTSQIQILNVASNAYVTYQGVQYGSNDVATMLAEDVYGQYSDSNYVGNVIQLSTYTNATRIQSIDFHVATITPAIQEFIDYGNNSNLPDYYFLNVEANKLKQISLSDYANSNYLSTTFPALFSVFNEKVEQWNTYYIAASAPTDVSATISDVRMYASNINTVYLSYNWPNITSNINTVQRLINDTYTISQPGLSNIIYSSSNAITTIPFSSSLSDLYQDAIRLNYKYFEIKRVPQLTYDDIIHKRIRLTNESPIIDPNAFTISLDTSVVDFGTASGDTVNWETCPFMNVITSNVNPIPTSVFFPQVQYDSLIPIIYPTNGLYKKNAISGQVSYTPFNPFAASDTMKFIATSNNLSQEVTWNISYSSNAKVEPTIYASMYKFGYTDTIATSNIYRATTSNIIPLWDTYTVNTSNVIDGTSSSCNYQVSLLNTYNPSKGYAQISSNVLTSNSDWFLYDVADGPSGSNGVNSIYSAKKYRYYELDYDGNITVINPQNYQQTLIEVSSNLTGFNSNYIYYSNIDVSVYYYRAYNRVTDTIDADKTHWDYVAASDSNYYIYSSNVPIRLRDPSAITVVGNTQQFPATGSNAYDIYIRYISDSNITVYDPLYKLHRNALFSLQGNYTTTTPGLGYFVASNAGVVESFTQADVDSGNISLRLSAIPDAAQIALNTGTFMVRKFLNDNVIRLSDVTSNAFSTLAFGPTAAFPTIFDPNRNGLPSGFTPQNIHITSTKNGWFPSGLTVNTTDINNYTYYSTFNYDQDEISFIYSSNNIATSPITYRINFTRYSYYDRQYFNIGTNSYDTSIISYDAFNWHDDQDDVFITALPSPDVATLNVNQFSIRDVISGNVKVAFTSNVPTFFKYNTSSTTNNTFQLIPYSYYAYPSVRIVGPQSMVLYKLGDDDLGIRHYHDANSPFWDFLVNMQTQGIRVDPDDILVHIVSTPPSSGFLWNIAKGDYIASSFTLRDIMSDLIYFIPYNPDYIPNITMQIKIQYQNTLSPSYSLTIRNWYSRFKRFSSSTTFRNRDVFDVNNDVSMSSQGFTADGLSWSPSTISIPYYASNIPAYYATTVAVGPLGALGAISGLSNAITTINTPLYASSIPIAWPSSTLNVTVDQADSVSLAGLFNYIGNERNRGDLQNIIFYITQRPLNGIILNTTDASANAAVRFTDTELANGSIIYQHFGAEEFTDTFKVGLATTPYDIDSNEITVQVAIQSIPRVVINQTAFIYNDTASSALSFQNKFNSSNLTISAASDSSYVHFINKQWISVRSLASGQEISSCSYEQFRKGNVYFSISSSNVFANPGASYPKLSMDIVCNNYASELTYNPLIAYHPAYSDYFKIPFSAYINRYVSSNIVVNNSQNSRQTLEYEYDKSLSGYSNITDHVFNYFLQFQPYQNLLPSDFESVNGVRGSEVLRTFHFTIQFQDQEKNEIINMNFDHSGVTTGNRFYPYSATNPITFGKWNNLFFINEDSDNNRKASLYINYDNTISKQLNKSRNLLLGTGSKIDMNNLGNVKVSLDITEGAIAASNFVIGAPGVPGAPGTLSRSFELTNYSTSMFFRNQEMYTSTYSLDSSDVNIQRADVHNVVVGKNIIVRGTNNICVGNTFNTSGQYSIVIGNNIGAGIANEGQGTINELYQCIIIGNKSFENSITRDIIAIGNNNFNSLSTAPQEAVNSFLSSKPIVVANDLTEDAIDYTVNVGNTFLKTINGGEQVYLGRSSEVVGIGFASNVYLHSGYDLHVNGAFASGRNTVPYWSLNNMYIPPCVPVSWVDESIVKATDVDRDPTVIGVCDACVVDNTTGLYKVYVQQNGVANVAIEDGYNVDRGSLLFASASNNGTLRPQDDALRYSYTVAKALKSGSNVVPCMLIL
jgi:hypothetical protein